MYVCMYVYVPDTLTYTSKYKCISVYHASIYMCILGITCPVRFPGQL